ncbi:hypothetical protein GN157_06295 [Flavobacterium rakeshii]|uniref:Uncharacterized protein n=1 Tax=Flavobacterium rakeshii TaxID=1038845 RepID=A0A6N8HD94_9FLAO|nr:hypothetical protein [Flavobacterium rakeshii]MUV03316.1 hypothetical protein [Flavobacterium rakeshii]
MTALQKKTIEYNNLKKELDAIAEKNYGRDLTGGFPSEDVLEAYINANRAALKRLNLLREQVEKLSYESLSPEKKAEEDSALKKMKLKRKGKL